MPFTSHADLPDNVKNNLPTHGQEIYKEAFNSAYQQYQDPSKRDDPKESVEEVAHQVAWSAVKNVYHKVDGKWVKKD